MILGDYFLLVVLDGTPTAVDVNERFLVDHHLSWVDGSAGDHTSSLVTVDGLDGDQGTVDLVTGPVCLLAPVTAVKHSHAHAGPRAGGGARSAKFAQGWHVT